MKQDHHIPLECSIGRGGPGVLGLSYHREWVQVAVFEPTNEDGKRAVLEHVCMPAKFFRLRVGDILVTSGSGRGMEELFFRLGNAVADGMVGFEVAPL